MFDHKEVLAFALETFKKGLIDKTHIHPDIKSVIYAVAIWSDDSHYEIVKAHYKETTVQEDKAKFLSALGNSKNEALLHATLDFCLSSDVRFAHILYVLSGISRNPQGKAVTLEWLVKNWETLLQASGRSPMYMRHILKLIIPICGTIQSTQASEFLEKHSISGLEKTFMQVKEELETNLQFIKKNEKKN